MVASCMRSCVSSEPRTRKKFSVRVRRCSPALPSRPTPRNPKTCFSSSAFRRAMGSPPGCCDRSPFNYKNRLRGRSTTKEGLALGARPIGVAPAAPDGIVFSRFPPPTFEVRSMPPIQPLRVLLVEDNPVNQRVACRMLEKNGHTVVVAGNGREALRALEGQEFDAVFMDVQMPEMDGFEATAAIRELERGT